jgi:hypothetical protein
VNDPSPRRAAVVVAGGQILRTVLDP